MSPVRDRVYIVARGVLRRRAPPYPSVQPAHETQQLCPCLRDTRYTRASIRDDYYLILHQQCSEGEGKRACGRREMEKRQRRVERVC